MQKVDLNCNHYFNTAINNGINRANPIMTNQKVNALQACCVGLCLSGFVGGCMISSNSIDLKTDCSASDNRLKLFRIDSRACNT